MRTYQTQDTPLATTLALCNVPHPVNSAGKPIPFYRIYSADYLRRLGLKGVSLWDAGQTAWKARKLGQVVYNFIRDEQCDRVLELWKKAGKNYIELEKLQTATIPMAASIETVVMLCAAVFTKRKILTEGPYQAVPLVTIEGPLRTEPDGESVIIIGSFRAISLNASEELRRKVGL